VRGESRRRAARHPGCNPLPFATGLLPVRPRGLTEGSETNFSPTFQPDHHVTHLAHHALQTASQYVTKRKVQQQQRGFAAQQKEATMTVEIFLGLLLIIAIGAGAFWYIRKRAAKPQSYSDRFLPPAPPSARKSRPTSKK